VSVQVETFGTGKIADDAIAKLLKQHFDFRLAGIIRQFDQRRLPSPVQGGFYRKLAAYGHVGQMDTGLPWEVTDKMAVLHEFGGHLMK
jgi:S-adenosylmethionine synthetase